MLTQKELLANVSHELRTLLARVRVALDIANEGDANATRSSLEEISADLGELEGIDRRHPRDHAHGVAAPRAHEHRLCLALQQRGAG